jgi:hypothetical protein
MTEQEQEEEKLIMKQWSSKPLTSCPEKDRNDEIIGWKLYIPIPGKYIFKNQLTYLSISANIITHEIIFRVINKTTNQFLELITIIEDEDIILSVYNQIGDIHKNTIFNVNNTYTFILALDHLENLQILEWGYLPYFFPSKKRTIKTINEIMKSDSGKMYEKNKQKFFEMIQNSNYIYENSDDNLLKLTFEEFKYYIEEYNKKKAKIKNELLKNKKVTKLVQILQNYSLSLQFLKLKNYTKQKKREEQAEKIYKKLLQEEETKKDALLAKKQALLAKKIKRKMKRKMKRNNKLYINGIISEMIDNVFIKKNKECIQTSVKPIEPIELNCGCYGTKCNGQCNNHSSQWNNQCGYYPTQFNNPYSYYLTQFNHSSQFNGYYPTQFNNQFGWYHPNLTPPNNYY